MSKQFLYDSFVSLKADGIVRFLRHAPVVLFYHGVAEHPDPLVELESIPLDQFERQMDYLNSYYEVISPQDFLRRYETQNWEGREVLLTFDDGYKNMLTSALPILERYRFPFLLFFTTNNIDHNELFATTVNRLVVLASSIKHITIKEFGIDAKLDSSNRTIVASYISRLLKTRPIRDVNTIVSRLLSALPDGEIESLREQYSSVIPMDWNDAQEISLSPLCTIGSHCMDHICCHSNQPIDCVKEQICQSKRIIEDRLGKPCLFFSYPNGSFTLDSNAIVKDAGYLMGFSTKRLPINGLSQWSIPRQMASYDYSRFVYSLVTYPK